MARHPSLREIAALDETLVEQLLAGRDVPVAGREQLRVDWLQVTRKYGAAMGIYGERGGWLYQAGVRVCQGWRVLWQLRSVTIKGWYRAEIARARAERSS
jgi:hypothetical protein